MLVELLHKVAAMESEDDEFIYRPRPSMAGPDRCIKQMVYQARGIEPESTIPARLLHIFNDGHWHEELTNEWIGKTAFDIHSSQMGVTVPRVLEWMPNVEYECTICHDMVTSQDLHGHIDGIVTDILLTDRLYEHKGLSHFVCQRYENLNGFPEDYFAQVAIYLRGLQRVNPDLKEALLVIKNKNTCGFLEYLCAYDSKNDNLNILQMTTSEGDVNKLDQVRERIVTGVVEKFRAVHHFSQTQTFPDRPFEYDDWHCNFCRYSQDCWSGYVDGLKSLSEEADLEPEWADSLRYYQELGAHIKEQELEKEEIRKKILGQLESRQLKKGRAGEYVASLTASFRGTVRWDTLPPSVIEKVEASKTFSPVIQLRISKRQIEGEQENT